jgi:hypothetical protein
LLFLSHSCQGQKEEIAQSFPKQRENITKVLELLRLAKRKEDNLKPNWPYKKLNANSKFIDLLFLFLNQEHLVSRFIPNLCRTKVLVPFIRDFTNIFIACKLN